MPQCIVTRVHNEEVTAVATEILGYRELSGTITDCIGHYLTCTYILIGNNDITSDQSVNCIQLAAHVQTQINNSICAGQQVN